MAITVMGLSVSRFPSSANPDYKRAEMDVLYTHQNVDTNKIVRNAIGRTSKEPFGKEPLKINPEYAELLINSRALVSGEDYDVVLTFNDEEMTSEITELKPVKPEVQKHFQQSLADFNKSK